MRNKKISELLYCFIPTKSFLSVKKHGCTYKERIKLIPEALSLKKGSDLRSSRLKVGLAKINSSTSSFATYKYYNNYNELVSRLSLLCASIDAGNNLIEIRNEISEILNILLIRMKIKQFINITFIIFNCCFNPKLLYEKAFH